MKYYKASLADGDVRLYRNNPKLHWVQNLYWSVYNKRDRVWIDSPNPHIFALKVKKITEAEAFLELL